jgi:hypothetical protein
MMIWPIEKLTELIPSYLRGELSQEEVAAFNEGLAVYTELKSELEDSRQLAIGLEITDRLSASHPSSLDIVSFVYQPQQLSRELATEIERHLKQCDHCREEYELSRQAMLSVGQESVPSRAKSASVFERLRNILFPRQFVLRPAYAYLVIILLALPTYLGVHSLYIVHPIITEFSVHVSSERGTEAEDLVDIMDVPKNSDFISLRFPSFPSSRNHSYNLTILDNGGRTVSAWYDQQIGDSTALDVPAALFSGDTYTLVFEEIDPSGKKTDTFAPNLLRVKHSE